MTNSDERPRTWFGHATITVNDPARSHEFYVGLGMRTVLCKDDFAITELRGGTHLIFIKGGPDTGDAPFDLMVEDLPAAHQAYLDANVQVSDIVEGDIHNTFVVTDPDGYRITISDSHVIGAV